MKDGHGTLICRWFGHRLVYDHGERTWREYPWDWPPDRIIRSAEYTPGSDCTALVCWRCRRRFTWRDGHGFVEASDPLHTGSIATKGEGGS